jgi:uncharacterized protein YndB with AHSA1/START domain
MNKTVQVLKQIQAPVDKVYKAWTNPESMAKWFTPMPKMSARVDSTFKQGEKYTTRMIMEGGEDFEIKGEYIDIQENKLLVFSWITDDCKNTTVKVSFEEKDGGTLLTLSHEGLDSEESLKSYTEGWKYTLDCCANIF